MGWTPDRVETLKKLWAKGLSASQIANQLGGVTRNAVIGKVRRIKLEGRVARRNPLSSKKNTSVTQQKVSRPKNTEKKSIASAISSSTRSSSAIVAKTAFNNNTPPRQSTEKSGEKEAGVFLYARPYENTVVPISRHLRLDELTERTCKWPNGDPLKANFYFCGNDADEGPYCKYHARIAFQPASERRRSR
jgi:GcrA cell cycle regulator